MTARWMTAALSVAVATSLAVAPARAAEGDATGATDATVGELTSGAFAWPVKESFMTHLQGPIARGSLVGSGGAEFKDSQFVFPVDKARTAIDAQGNGTIGLSGTASIEAYAGLGANGGLGLDVEYSDLKIVVEATRATLVGDFAMAGDPGDKDNPTSAQGDDVALVTFDLDKSIKPGHDAVSLDRVTTAGAGLEASLLRYKAGDVLDDGRVDLVLDYADGNQAPSVTGAPLEGVDKLSSELAQGNAGAIAGVVAGVVAAVVGLVAALGAAGSFLPQLDLRAELDKLGITV